MPHAEQDLAALTWIVWDIEVRDPQHLVPEGIGSRTEQMITEAARGLGCVYDSCCDDDSYDSYGQGLDVRYYSWHVRVPRDAHSRRDADDVPAVVVALRALLRAALPDGLDDWVVMPDVELTDLVAMDERFRTAYDDLLGPLEGKLLGIRRDGAEKLEPVARAWAADGDLTAGTYSLWLCDDGAETGEGSYWLVVQAGLILPGRLAAAPLGESLRHRSVETDSPVLLLPRPKDPRWLVDVTTAGFSASGASSSRWPVGARFRWVSEHPEQLARRVADDLAAMIPRLRG